MTNEQVTEIIKKYDVLGCGYCHQGGKEIEEAFNMATKALDTWDKIFTSYENLVAKIESEDDISHATERIDEWCVEQLRSVISDYYADRIIKELNLQADEEKVFKMRDATPEERESIDKYIKSISKPTGVNFWDLADGEYISKEKAIIQLSWDLSEVELPRIKESLDKLPSVDIPPEHDGCKDCKYETNPNYYYPCRSCKQNYMDEWEAIPNKIGH